MHGEGRWKNGLGVDKKWFQHLKAMEEKDLFKSLRNFIVLINNVILIGKDNKEITIIDCVISYSNRINPIIIIANPTKDQDLAHKVKKL